MEASKLPERLAAFEIDVGVGQSEINEHMIVEHAKMTTFCCSRLPTEKLCDQGSDGSKLRATA